MIINLIGENMKTEEERKKKFMKARGGSVSDTHVKVNGEWVVDETLKKAKMAKLLKEINSMKGE
tara:strand:+ start:922 stop:1113 length:192 start_codon:yes stop_codon:yes gene_type:complete